MESFAHQVSCHVFVFLGKFYMNSLDELTFGLGKGVSRAGCEVGREGQGQGFLVSSQMFFHFNPRAMVGPLGSRHCRSPSKISVRKVRSECS